jgi:drug/metabolite transporter (DMT)-like permease
VDVEFPFRYLAAWDLGPGLPDPAGGDVVPTLVMPVLLAAVLHAGWNAIAKGVPDRLGLWLRMSLAGATVAALALPWVAGPARPSWFWLGASVLLHVGYNVALMAAYRVGDFNQTYPLARGVGPLVVAVVAVLLLGESLPPVPALGVVLIAGSVALLGLTPWQRVRDNPAAVVAALATGLTIASYTLVDAIGVRRSDSTAGYTLWLFGLQGLATVCLIAPRLLARGRGDRRRPSGTGAWSLAATASLMSMLAYGLVLWAQTRGAVAAVAALRESSVVVAALIGTVFFSEPLGRLRVLASVAIAGGVVLLAMPHA